MEELTRKQLMQLLEMKKNKMWRRGILQGLISCGYMRQAEWELLTAIYVTDSPMKKREVG